MNREKKIKPNDISNEMICSIASIAALGVDGIEKMFMRLSDEILDAIYPTVISKGVKVVKNDLGYVVDLHVITTIDAELPKVARNAQVKVKESVEVMAGSQVAEVNVHVEGCGKY